MKSIKILDLTCRFPGPKATSNLANLGFSVTKLEDLNQRDPFASDDFKKIDGSFYQWYQEFNRNKKLILIENEKDWAKEVEQADLCVFHPSKHHPYKSAKELQKINPDLIVLEIKASKNKKPLHDLNVLAELGILQAHLRNSSDQHISPPFLPIAGIYFAEKITEACMYLLLQKDSLYRDIYLDECIAQNILPLITHFKNMSQGRFLCYNIYSTIDPRFYLVITCIEEKYWDQFIDHFSFQKFKSIQFSDDQKDIMEFNNAIKKISLENLQGLSLKTNCISLVQVN